ncbi:130aa long hypothetical protein [Pyrococcus horikoshii OT3]|uniref:Uncharacterized protein n=1 Tax=Pyrococcus horikoshii (strain ATCC 700860 / DSM 12428 / JCM 9974 / NBRC 100139 / OT-3) TaxID=70601 RepID=O59149_PYRHO|nr:130aa long hypothetical protein [Pyrococcus horikoshii OT3]
MLSPHFHPYFAKNFLFSLFIVPETPSVLIISLLPLNSETSINANLRYSTYSRSHLTIPVFVLGSNFISQGLTIAVPVSPSTSKELFHMSSLTSSFVKSPSLIISNAMYLFLSLRVGGRVFSFLITPRVRG